jgi:hypothetical protein
MKLLGFIIDYRLSDFYICWIVEKIGIAMRQFMSYSYVYFKEVYYDSLGEKYSAIVSLSLRYP